MPDRRNREGGESSALEVQADQGCEVIITDKNSSELSGQKRLSILSWNAGPKRGEVTSSTVGSFHVIMVQEAQTH